jgi:hypothetical protein
MTSTSYNESYTTDTLRTLQLGQTRNFLDGSYNVEYHPPRVQISRQRHLLCVKRHSLDQLPAGQSVGARLLGRRRNSLVVEDSVQSPTSKPSRPLYAIGSRLHVVPNV